MKGRAISEAAFKWSPAKYAETTRVNAKRLMESVLGTEVGHRPGGKAVGVVALEPVAGAIGDVAIELVEQRLVLGHQVDVVEHLVPVVLRLDDRHGRAVAQPRTGIDPPEEHADARMPDPVQVVGQSFKTGEFVG